MGFDAPKSHGSVGDMRVALVHYWLVSWRGGERVLKAIADLFPTADIFAHVVDSEIIEREFPGRIVSTTFVSRLPFARKLYQRYLPLMPLALESLNLQDYDLVISSEAGPAKGVVVAPGAVHICYCHSPMRYAWDRYYDYCEQAGMMTRALMAPTMHYMRLWDQVSAQRVDHFVANSRFVAGRIEKYYRRTAEVIHPPVRVADCKIGRREGEFYLSVGQLVAYKRPDLLVEAFNSLGRPLLMIGGGELFGRLRRMARSNIRLVGSQSSEIIRDSYARCRALVFPGVEDFGIVPVEAMASGKPVIAYGGGGVLDTVVDGITGVLFHEQSASGVVDAVRKFEQIEGTFDPATIRGHAERFSEEVFVKRFSAFVDGVTR